MDHNYKDIGRIKELSGGRVYVRCAGNRAIVQATLSDVQTDLVAGWPPVPLETPVRRK